MRERLENGIIIYVKVSCFETLESVINREIKGKFKNRIIYARVKQKKIYSKEYIGKNGIRLTSRRFLQNTCMVQVALTILDALFANDPQIILSTLRLLITSYFRNNAYYLLYSLFAF